jgi:hypothetical protein
MIISDTGSGYTGQVIPTSFAEFRERIVQVYTIKSKTSDGY